MMGWSEDSGSIVVTPGRESSSQNAATSARQSGFGNTAHVDSSPSESNGSPELERSWIRRQARKCVRGNLRSTLDASDLTQETLLAAERGKDGKTFAGRGALRAWLRVILRNVAAQHARRRGSRTIPHALSSSVPDRWTASTSGENAHESQLRVQSMLQHLSDRNRKIVLLRVAENLPFSEIGKRLGMSETNARVAFNRVIKGLREREERAHGA